ncbi:hypothetical protein DFJ43DRAFT_1088454 [Lentinula guzmanii]|uniref:Uncharacterized protein n=2 Tax=Lentinula TaxID=5352 RepID=A0AA38MW14_9AGAR|nr:hypothetical protein DFJ43DRAFT_1102523 [Lentinula guzmanii]KAJ3745342.1 hypothetical protein DFH05DRAFT_1487566 [Lentinula detonsa]KAJ3715234.1 hypothetical protein DFJ43DRAFT_1102525 [Lentinula guzmanii]KAJ3715259.1 hypothetical protein DFJ43DRAFT_1102733 [Lentinula guzmanii]KAJ3725628.1 hypothetical protein DFJ43DRAFT_1088454 [Lentinula guzmanii]
MSRIALLIMSLETVIKRSRARFLLSLALGWVLGSRLGARVSVRGGGEGVWCTALRGEFILVWFFWLFGSGFGSGEQSQRCNHFSTAAGTGFRCGPAVSPIKPHCLRLEDIPAYCGSSKKSSFRPRSF